MATDFQERARRLRHAVEPVAAGVYFAPEAHTEYTKLGFAGSPPVSPDGIARPEMKSYFTSRSACMGQLPGEVVAAAFGCFNPEAVIPTLRPGWQIADRDTLLQARERGATAMLQRSWGTNRKDWTGPLRCSAGPRTRRHGPADRSSAGCARSTSRPPR